MNLDVKRAFVLADWMKTASRCENQEEFLDLLASEATRLANVAEGELDSIIRIDRLRLNRFETLAWTLCSASLGECYVYPRMGGRDWATGLVREVAPKFVRLESSSSRIWKMKSFSALFGRLPLIVVMKEGRLEIDDGSHRAIAMFLSEITDAKAYIGC